MPLTHQFIYMFSVNSVSKDEGLDAVTKLSSHCQDDILVSFISIILFLLFCFYFIGLKKSNLIVVNVHILELGYELSTMC